MMHALQFGNRLVCEPPADAESGPRTSGGSHLHAMINSAGRVSGVCECPDGLDPGQYAEALKV